MKPRVLITRPIPQQVVDYINQYCDVKRWSEESPIPRNKLLEEVADVEGLMTTGGKINEELFTHAPHLKVVSNISVGYNNFDLEAMKKRKIIGTHTPYVLDDTVADLVMALILATARRIPELDQTVKQGKWKKGDEEIFFGLDVHHATIGIIGLGRIGQTIAKRAKYGFDMKVLYHSRKKKLELEATMGITYASKEDLLEQSDFVVVMTPLTPETHYLMGAKEFDQMKKSAILINASRGKTVDEQALIEALQQKKIFGAGLDVFELEPVAKDNPLLRMKNVVTLPHIGSATQKTRLDMAMVAAKNLVMGVMGEVPPYVVKELKER